jgi:flagellar hook protein FlgE
MSILQAMFTGVSGIQAEGEALGVVGDNISNTNTVGYKQERAQFENVLGHSIMAGSASALPGSGVRMAGVQQLFTQGSLSNTGVATDLALSGDGFFVVNGTIDGVAGNFYTRDGRLKVDPNGFISNQDGLKAQGYAAAANGTFDAAISSLKVPTSAIPAFATTQLTVTANLDSNATPPTVPFDGTSVASQPSQTSNFSTSISLYDSLGNAHTVNLYFVKTSAAAAIPATWDAHALANTAEVTVPASAGSTVEVGTGTLSFNADGSLLSNTLTTLNPALQFNGALVQSATGVAVNLGTGTGAAVPGTGLDGVTQFAGASNVSSQSQNGYASGDLSGIAVDGTGVVKGLYTNGQKLAIGQLAIAKFRSNEGLGAAGHNMWIETRDSGNAALGTAGSGGRAAVSAGAIEQSNVDLAQQFVDLIAHQRAFQANSKTITTADEMLQELENIKR